MLALTHVPSPAMEQCQRKYAPWESINYNLALRQHKQYCQTLQQCGVDVRILDVNRDLPDCAFIEDTAIVLDELALLASMGAASRRAEPAGIEPELSKYREVHHIQAPAVIEGGDVLRVGRTLLVGLSSRTNLEGISALEVVARGCGYTIIPVPVGRCLHLKTACTALPDNSLLVNPDWLDTGPLQGFKLIPVPPEEPWAANVACIGDNVCIGADHRRTAALIRELGFTVHPIDLSEFGKAEGGVTCLSILF